MPMPPASVLRTGSYLNTEFLIMAVSKPDFKQVEKKVVTINIKNYIYYNKCDIN